MHSFEEKNGLFYSCRICAKCGVQNFRRRDICFKCSGPRTESEYTGENEDEVRSIVENLLNFFLEYYRDQNILINMNGNEDDLIFETLLVNN